MDIDITNIESISTRKIYSVLTTFIGPDRIDDITGFEGRSILHVCMEYLHKTEA